MGGWTQTPNFIYDLMHTMKEAELKVVMAVVRQTIGWQAERVTLRLDDLVGLTGMSKPSVHTGIKAAMERGVLTREPNGDSFDYWITEPVAEDATVKNFNQEEEVESKKSLPSAVKNLNQEPVKNLNHNIKENINTNKPKKEDTATQPEARERSPTPQQEMFAAVCEAIGWDYKTLSKDDRGQVAQAAGILTKASYGVDDIRRFMVEVWFNDWRWTDKAQMPTLKVLRQEIGKIRSVAATVAPPRKRTGLDKFKDIARGQGATI